MKAIRVMIIEDSQVARALLEQLVATDPRLCLGGSYDNAESALRDIEKIAPDVISMDMHLPGMNGVEATRRVMELRPTPIVIASRSILQRDVELSIESLRAGALAVVDKPMGLTQAGFEKLANRYCGQLAAMSEVSVIRQRFNSRQTITKPASSQQNDGSPFETHPPLEALGIQAVGIVASTGGPNALEVLFSQLSPDLPAAVFLVQHITSSFHRGFVEWLGEISPLPTRIAEDGMPCESGHLYVAPADRDLFLQGRRCRIIENANDDLHCPSGNTLLRSMATAYGPRAIGVLLTGMGDDGAAGLKAMKEQGAYTIAEHSSTTVVNGMPEAARVLDAVCESIPLHGIGREIMNLFCIAQEVA